jgi:hypothetical protein
MYDQVSPGPCCSPSSGQGPGSEVILCSGEAQHGSGWVGRVGSLLGVLRPILLILWFPSSTEIDGCHVDHGSSTSHSSSTCRS